MALFDLLALSAVLAYALMGTKRGFLDQILRLIPTWGALVIIICTQPFWIKILAPWVHKSYRSTVSLSVGFIATYPLTILLARFIAFKLNATPLGWVNRFGGGVIGAVQGGLWVSLIVFFLWLTPISDEKSFYQSFIAQTIYPFVQKISSKYLWVALKSQPYSWADYVKQQIWA
jgi:uncharacterized membrane protein required for colicin V production